MQDRVFYALDYDRTLLDTDAVISCLEEFLLTAHSAFAMRLADERREVEQSGGSYDVITAMRRYSPDGIDSLIEEFISAKYSSRFLLPGAESLIKAIEDAGHPWGVVTYGGREWQRAKLRLTGLDGVHALIVETKGKGGLIASWRDQSGGYCLPDELGGMTVDKVVLIDDKAREFEGLPEDSTARGYRILHQGGEHLQSQAGNLPVNVTRVDTLVDIARLEQLIT